MCPQALGMRSPSNLADALPDSCRLRPGSWVEQLPGGIALPEKRSDRLGGEEATVFGNLNSGKGHGGSLFQVQRIGLIIAGNGVIAVQAVFVREGVSARRGGCKFFFAERAACARGADDW